ncbi:hypothetical protein BH24CHL6_BH24CHL6_17210 [soil metagenome]
MAPAPLRAEAVAIDLVRLPGVPPANTGKVTMQDPVDIVPYRRTPRAAAVAIGLIAVFILSAVAGVASPTRAALAASDGSAGAGDSPGAGLKAVIIVGPTHGLTASNLQRGETLAKVAESFGMDVRRVFHPRATWARVLANIQGANLVAYLGHGNGWPSPYGSSQEKTKNGFGLNPFEGAGKANVEYWGGNRIRNSIVLAPNAVVLLNHLCYAAGNGESGTAIPSWNIAHQRVDNFAAAFLTVGASSVFAYTSQPVDSVVQALFTTDKTMAQIFTSAGSKPEPYYGYVGWDARKLASVRVPGALNFLDPAQKSGFQRALSGDLGFRSGAWRGGSDDAPPSSGGGSLSPDTTAPSTPKGLSTEALGYRKVKLSWKASTDNRAGQITYRIFRNGVPVITVTTTSYTDRPLNAGTYSYKVRAFDEAGNLSSFSAVVQGKAIKGELTAVTPDTVAPTVPKGVAAEALGFRRVQLSWKASTDDGPGTITYRVFRNDVRIATVTTTSFTDRPASAGSYTYKVRAFDAAGNRSAFSTKVKGSAIKGAL